MAEERIALLRARKVVLDEGKRVRGSFDTLLNECEKLLSRPDPTSFDIFPVRAVALFEVFVRGWVRTIVNHSKDFAQRAIPVLQGYKADYAFLIEVAEGSITFGDIAAHAIPVSKAEHVLSIFQTLTTRKLSDVLPNVRDRWQVEVLKSPDQPLIENYGKVIADLESVFSLRHKVCHEACTLSRQQAANLQFQLRSVAEFVNALQWWLTEVLYGKVPLTQTDMNMEAIERANATEESMQSIVKELEYLLQNQTRALKLVRTTQKVWERYRNLQSYCAHDPEGGGTVGPLIRANEANSLTEERIARLRTHMAFSGLLALP